MAKITTKKGQMVSRHARVRKKVIGTSERPRLTVFRSLNNVYAQIIDDSLGNTIVASASLKLDSGDHLSEVVLVPPENENQENIEKPGDLPGPNEISPL